MFDSILNYYAKNHASYLHGHGLLATRKMLAQLQLQGHEKILEIGCGTGASLVFLKSSYPDLHVSGGDISPLMHQKASHRISFAGLHNAIDLHLFKDTGQLPFADENFDVIWIESVLAILDTPLLQQMLTQINRILKPGGSLIFNESLWLPQVSQKEIDHINQQCLSSFGIIQANRDFPMANDWHSLLEQHGFQINLETPFDTLEATVHIPNSFSYKRSQLFNHLGRLKALISLSQRSYQKELRQLECQIMGTGSQKLKAYLFLAQKPSS